MHQLLPMSAGNRVAVQQHFAGVGERVLVVLDHVASPGTEALLVGEAPAVAAAPRCPRALRRRPCFDLDGRAGFQPKRDEGLAVEPCPGVVGDPVVDVDDSSRLTARGARMDRPVDR